MKTGTLTTLRNDLILLVASAFFTALLKGKTLWVRDPIYGTIVEYTGKIHSVAVKRPVGNPELVIRCMASRLVEGERQEEREFFLTSGLNKIDKDIWELKP